LRCADVVAAAALILFELIFMLELELALLLRGQCVPEIMAETGSATGVDCGIGSGSMSAMALDLGTKCARAFS